MNKPMPPPEAYSHPRPHRGRAGRMRYAVIFKTYTWDGFVHRQASRCHAASGDGDFFIMVDETNGSIGDIPFERVVRTTNAQLVSFGLANRFEVGSLIWWNADYPHYQFKNQYPDYDYYVFVEYDAVIYGGIGYIVERAAALTADLVTLPIGTPKHEWFWTKFHRQAYRLAELQGSLNCVAVFSNRALTMLERRRREMAIGETHAVLAEQRGFRRHRDWSRWLYIPLSGRIRQRQEVQLVSADARGGSAGKSRTRLLPSRIGRATLYCLAPQIDDEGS